MNKYIRNIKTDQHCNASKKKEKVMYIQHKKIMLYYKNSEDIKIIFWKNIKSEYT